ncbi:MAG: ribosome-associated translation inhibitor RaiA [Gemmatimonadales bacterium]|nr:ribosome-associated translation inhibitor RaiA [Gemmatimonadales bacterium]MDX2057529.1 ribosome-associated translation inhibitor RaiA [Gemmatimonadales bacterium]
MQTTITARHCEVGEELRARAAAVMERMERYSPHALEAQVVFDVGADGQTAELRLHVRGGQILVGLAAADDHRTALDRAEEKVKRQLEKATAARRPRRSAADS